MTDETAPAPQSSGAGLVFEKFVRLLNAIGSVWILGLLILINADVFGRNLLHAPIDGVIEMIEISPTDENGLETTPSRANDPESAPQARDGEESDDIQLL